MTISPATLVLLALFAPVATLAPASATAQQPMHHQRAEARPSTSLMIHAGGQSLTLSVADLKALPQITVNVYNAHSKQNQTYTGPLVADVLAKADLRLSEQTQHHILDSYAVATGTDGYFVVYSGAELQPGLHKAQPIIAIAESGKPLTTSGAFQLIDPSDVKPARWVRNLDSLTVVPVTAPTR